jgi:two-component system sensor histidine kinase KdpD
VSAEPTSTTLPSRLPGSDLGVVGATAVVALAAAAGVATERGFGYTDQALIFVAAVVYIALRARTSVTLYAVALCFLAYNFFFLEPRYTFYIHAGKGIATIVLFLLLALAVSRLANRLNEQLLARQAAHARSAALQELSARLATAVDRAAVLAAAEAGFARELEAGVTLLLGDADGHLVAAGTRQAVDPVLRAAAYACLARPQEPGSAVDLGGGRRCLPLTAGERVLGVACLSRSGGWNAEGTALAAAMTQIVAASLARVELAGQLTDTRVVAEAERLRAALLSSVSHDLRSPLATIIGSAENLMLFDADLAVEDRRQLAGDIVQQGRRLDRYIQNLLDLTRLGSAPGRIVGEWIGIDDLLGAVLPRLWQVHRKRRIELALPDPAPALRVQPDLFEQALFNLIDNALKFDPGDEPLTLRLGRDGDDWCLDLRDHGPGIAPADRLRVFDPFFRAEQGDRAVGGSGLGLAISAAIVRAHGGRIEALAPPSGPGAVLRVRLPYEAEPAVEWTE